MAQAARLNLRMQKELKLLLSDPPPGASFPLLSSSAADSSASFSLSTIHARIEGPAGTVYANGVFGINIQIPERYPFQPPCVTFATPIYHPNIDTGGRICLDILNLPPKGAWQPSLNIWTVLTSIGLLLSEPNPDDGLMIEASREYKYNRQAFDQKARSMTEKFANAVANLNSGGSQITQIRPSPSKMQVEGSSRESAHETSREHMVSQQRGIRRKLSLESSSSLQNRDAHRVDEMPNELKIKAKGPDEGLSSGNVSNPTLKRKLSGVRQRLSLKSSPYAKVSSSGIEENQVLNCRLPHLNPLRSSLAPSSLNKDSDHCKQVESESTPPERRYEVSQAFSSCESSQTCQAPASNNVNMPLSPRPSESLPLCHLKVPESTGPFNQVVEYGSLQPVMDAASVAMDDTTIKTGYKKLQSVGKKLCLGSLSSSQRLKHDNKENQDTLHTDSRMPSSDASKSSGKNEICRNEAEKLHEICRKELREPLSRLYGNNSDKSKSHLLHRSGSLCQAKSKSLQLSQDEKYYEQHQQQHPVVTDRKTVSKDKKPVMDLAEEKALPDAGEIIVLDSEESEEENGVSSRSNLVVARRCLARKRKAKVLYI